MKSGMDVIVVGLGAMGSCALAELAARGVRALGIDRFDPPHASGSSHGGSRVIRLSYFEHPDYVPLLRRAYECFDRLSDECGEALRRETGLVVGGVPGNVVSAGMLRSAREHGLEVEAIDGGELRRRHPQFSVPSDWEIVTEKRGGFVRPEATIRAALARAARLGARIERNMPIRAWGADGAHAWVETDAGRFEAGALVFSSGAWMPGLLGVPAVRLEPTRETLVWLDDARDPSWQESTMPVWLFDRGIEPAVYGIPAFEGMGDPGGMKVGLHGRGPRVRPEQIAEPIDEAVVRETVTATVERVPSALARKVIAAKHCLYTMSADTDFVVGLHPSHANVAIACGFSGHGFKFAPVMGEVLADLATTRGTKLPIGFLSPGRFRA
jgi:sarcosine oxidase